MRDLSRVFHGVLLTPKESITEGGLRAKQGKLINFSPQNMLIGLWKHKCDWVFCDKLTTNKDKESYSNFVEKIGSNVFGDDLYCSACREKKFMVSFLRDDIYDEDEVLVQEAPKVYEDGGMLEMIQERAYTFPENYNEEYLSKKIELVLFEDALKHMLRINRL